MNVKNFMKPYQEATKKQKYDKVKDVFWSCDDVIQKYVTLKWALRIGITDRRNHPSDGYVSFAMSGRRTR
jgi:hypothetical protein